MEIVIEFEDIERNLSQLKRDFNNEFNLLTGDLKEFHKHMIELISKYPDQKEIIEFIVFINDRLETNHTNTREILSESINQLINLKKELVKSNIKARRKLLIDTANSEDNEDNEDNKLSIFKNIIKRVIIIKDMKLIVVSISITTILISYIIAPETTTHVFEWLVKIFGEGE